MERTSDAAIPASGTDSDPTAARMAILASTVLWGTLWIPLRQLDAAGLNGAWATTGGFALPLLVLLPLGIRRRRGIAAGGRPLFAAGFLLAASIALYAEGLLRGQVAHVILLFYVTPVWSTVLARVLLRHPITGRRVVSIALGLCGMFVVFGAGGGIPLPRTVAECMGLLSGFLWGWSMVHLRTVDEASDLEKTIVPFLFLAAVFFLFSLIPGGRTWAIPTATAVADSAHWLLALAFVWMPFVLALTIYGGSRIDPGQVALLLMLEIVIGLGSAALLAGEPFGTREGLGAVLILGACAAESSASRQG
jgi:drug/metabolite transporter (DMT)-like permease